MRPRLPTSAWLRCRVPQRHAWLDAALDTGHTDALVRLLADAGRADHSARSLPQEGPRR